MNAYGNIMALVPNLLIASMFHVWQSMIWECDKCDKKYTKLRAVRHDILSHNRKASSISHYSLYTFYSVVSQITLLTAIYFVILTVYLGPRVTTDPMYDISSL